jgi:hypothetical protein
MTGMHPIATQDSRPAADDPRGAGRTRLRMTPGRRAALVFGVPVCLALVAATGLSFAADLGTANFSVNYAFPASAKRIAVSTDGGQLTLAQAPVDQATLTGTAQYSLLRPKPAPAFIGGVASYDYHCRSPFGSCGLTATVTIPVGMTASMSTGGGNAQVTGTTGDVTLNSGGGQLTAQDVSGTVTLTTGGGNITVGNASGPLTLDTDGGSILANAIQSIGVTASSGGGNITITFTAVPTDVNVSTAGGDITIVVPDDPAQHYHVTASTDGGTVSDAAIPKSDSSTHVITATSGGGNITIREA